MLNTTLRLKFLTVSERLMSLSSTLILKILTVLLPANSFAQNPGPLIRELIKEYKPCVGVIMSPKWQGTFFFIQSETGIPYLFTARHIFKDVDSATGDTTYYDYALVRINGPDSAITYRVKVVRRDSLLDFAALWFEDEKLKKVLPNFNYVPFSSLEVDVDVEEGDEVLYFGFPYRMGAQPVDRFNYPLARKGMVSQVITGKPVFVLQGSTGGGSSGSPVFSTRTGHLLGMIVNQQVESGIALVISSNQLRRILQHSSR